MEQPGIEPGSSKANIRRDNHFTTTPRNLKSIGQLIPGNLSRHPGYPMYINIKFFIFERKNLVLCKHIHHRYKSLLFLIIKFVLNDIINYS